MSSYLKLFQDFLQKKETVDVRRSATALPYDESDDDVVDSQTMEHSYTRDDVCPAGELITGLAPARTILVRRPAQCPSCHPHPLEETDFDSSHQATVPPYNEIAAKEAMNECARIANYVKNLNPDDEDWEARIKTIDWSYQQKTLFENMVKVLDSLHLSRLTYEGRPNEAMHRRVHIDKATTRARKSLAMIEWDPNLTQWLHGLLMEHLPATYMASYLDILQALKTKLPTLMDKMLFGRPLNFSQELLAPVMKKQWEPIIPVKTRKLSQNAIIVALSPMPVSGPVPFRLQKWYQHLATMAQVVPVTLPITSGQVTRLPLDIIAEQIVCLTRVKIQELRNENPTRSIILVGFCAGASLALQVVLSETVACVVCMGFAYHTLNGERGAPDDRILDIKVPILFVLGQNSARASAEEMEFLREKMQSETNLLIVGSADGQLRMSKSRRQIESVTQAMVDSMVVDEIYEYLKKTLANPPGPRIPTSITSAIYPKNAKPIAASADSTTGKVTAVQRKRKQEATGDPTDHIHTPVKTKYLAHIGRPRTRPLPINAAKPTPSTPSSVSSNLSNSISNDDLNMAMQCILSDDIDGVVSTTHSERSPPKTMTNFELVAQSKSTPLKASMLKSLQKTSLIGSTTPAIGTKIKMIPSNQFVQLKPPAPMQSQSKIYTIKPSAILNQAHVGGASIGSIVKTSPSPVSSGQQQIFTLKSPNGQTTQFVTAAPASAPQKYTVVKNAAGGTTLQLTSGPPTSIRNAVGSSSLDLSIIDMPIIFADSEGNLTDSVAAGNDAVKTQITTATPIKPSTSTGVGQLIINQKIIKEATSTSLTPSTGSFVINTPGTIIQQQQQATSKNNKVVLINRNTMKPCPTILSRSTVAQQLSKYTKVVVTNAKSNSTAILPRTGIPNTAAITGTTPITSTVKQINLQPLKAPTSVNVSGARQPGIINVGTKTFQIINSPNAAVTGDKSQIPHIVLKPGGLKQIPDHLKSQLLNRNLTVRKLVNIVPAAQSPVVSSPNTPASSPSASVTISPAQVTIKSQSPQDDATESAPPTPSITSLATTNCVSPSAIQTSPKIITLNPINPSTVAINNGSGGTQ